MAKMNNLHDLFIHELKDIHHAEGQIVKALPKMSRAAQSPALKAAFEEHLAVTEEQKHRLERIFEQLDATPRGVKCVGMEGLIEEGQDIIGENADPAVKDAGLIAAAQRIEHYEIAVYGTLRTFANLLGHHDIAGVLEQSLDEEKAADEKLTQIAEQSINVAAA